MAKMYQGHIVIEDENDDRYYKILRVYMDFIGDLPLELSHLILGYLSVDDLGRCLQISKKWHRIVNDDFLWKRHCLRVGISPTPTSDSPRSSFDLCPWASAWKEFAFSRSYNWGRNKYELLYFNSSRYGYQNFAYHGNNFVAYSVFNNNLDVYYVTKSNPDFNKMSRIKLQTSIALCIPHETLTFNGEIFLFMSKEFIIFGKGNMVLVFKLNISEDYDLYKAIKIGLLPEFVDRNIHTFVTENWDPIGLLDVFGIMENYLWFQQVVDENVLAIDVYTNEYKNILSYETREIMKNCYITWSDIEESVRIYDKEGNLAVFLDEVDWLEDVLVNESLVCTQRGMPPDGQIRIDLWEFSTGQNIFFEQMPVCTWSKLHPSKEILYTLEASVRERFYKITSWDPRSHKKIWIYENTSIIGGFDSVISYWELHEVCDKYIIVWPLLHGQEKFGLLDANSGKLIYESTRPHMYVETNYINDFMWLSVSRYAEEITIRCYM